MRRTPNRRWSAGRAALLTAIALVLVPTGFLEAQTGSVAGRVELEAQPARRTASRYAGGTAAAEHLQAVPAVVYIVGSVAGSSPPSRPAEMIQKDTAFTPAAVFVGVGSSVEFPNDDPFFHNVFAYSETRRFDLGRYPQGQSKTVDFPDPGVVGVFCEVHDKMRGVIVVAENPFYALVGVDGSFRIDGLPPGTYEVAFWSADHEPKPQVESVTVAAGETTRIEVELRR